MTGVTVVDMTGGVSLRVVLAVSMIASGARFDDSQAMDKAMDGNNVLFHGYAVFALVAMVYYVMGAGEDSRTRALYACLKDRQAIERARPSTMMRTCLEEDLGVSIDLTSR